jgi:hypothetical protein
MSVAGGDVHLVGPHADQFGQAGVITIVTPTTLTQTLQTSVTALVNSGAMLPADGTSLQAKLNAALAAGDTATAKTKLQDFINQVNAMVKAHRLTATQGQALINAASAILALIA